METLYLVCAVFGTTVLIGQFLLTLLGFSHHGGDFDHEASLDHAGGGSAGDSSIGDSHDGNASTNAAHHDQATNWLFNVLTFRTLTAAVAFFGMAGMAATSAALPSPEPLLIAVVAGLAALYGVYYLMRGLYRLNCEGTQRIERALGQEAVVYLSIPAGQTGPGKIHLTLQNRLLEIEAVTTGESLPTGARVVVTAICTPDCVEVEAIPETARTIHV